jgi:hypothetical protein
MRCDCGIDKRLSERLQLGERAFFVSAHQKTIASDIRRQNSCQPPLYVLAAQDAPPKLTELRADVRLRPSPKRVTIRHSAQPHRRSALRLMADISVARTYVCLLGARSGRWRKP